MSSDQEQRSVNEMTSGLILGVIAAFTAISYIFYRWPKAATIITLVGILIGGGFKLYDDWRKDQWYKAASVPPINYVALESENSKSATALFNMSFKEPAWFLDMKKRRSFIAVRVMPVLTGKQAEPVCEAYLYDRPESTPSHLIKWGGQRCLPNAHGVARSALIYYEQGRPYRVYSLDGQDIDRAWIKDIAWVMSNSIAYSSRYRGGFARPLMYDSWFHFRELRNVEDFY